MSRTGFTTRSIDGGEQKRKKRGSTSVTMNWKEWMYGVIAYGQKTHAYWKNSSTSEKRMMFYKGGAIVGGIGCITLLFLWYTLPNIDDPETMFPSQSTVIVDRNEVELYRLFSEQDRTYVHGDAINPLIKKATIAIEDERFLEREGCIDVIGFLRAAISQVLPRFFVRSGGSTLPQQFAKNALVGQERSITRKIRELMLACKLQQRYNKDELLELYLNWIPYGHNAYGVEQAAHNYFSKNAKDVSLAEAVILAALPQRPSYFNPYGKNVRTTVSADVEKKIQQGSITSIDDIDERDIRIGLLGNTIGSGANALTIGGRTDQVLQNMKKQGFITEQEEQKAKNDLRTIVFASKRQNIRAPHFVLAIEKQVKDILGVDDHLLEQGGFRIQTTLDWKMQEIAEKVIKRKKDDAKDRFHANNLALLALSPETREVLSYVGNSDFLDEEHEGKIDMVTVPRQPGSSFKPITYAAALEAGYGPGSILYDVPTKFGTDEPQNFDGTFWGPITLRRALAGSRNIPAIKAFFLAGGEEPVLSLAERMGAVSPAETKRRMRKSDANFDFGWPLAIGAAETPLKEMVTAYATLADGGMYLPVTTILNITDKDGNIRYSAKKEVPKQVIDARITAMITSVLQDKEARPQNDYWKSILSIPGFEAAAKTGTSNKCLERSAEGNCTLRRPESLWTIGYTPNLITGVWAGNATSESLSEKADGLTVAAPIWHDFMTEANQLVQDKKTAFTLPSGLSRPLLSLLSGKLASDCTPIDKRQADLVLEENIPTEEDPACVQAKVDQVTGLLPSKECPEDAVKESAFFSPESELPKRWPLWEQAVQQWAKKQNVLWMANESHSGSLLPLALLPTEQCDPSLTPGRLEKPIVTIVSPKNGSSISPQGFSPIITVESKANIQNIELTIDDVPLATFSSLPISDSIRIPSSIAQGKHTLIIKVTDEYFNTASQSIAITIEEDRTPPSITILSPEDGTSFAKNDTLTMNVDVTDESGVDRVQFFLDGTLLTTKRVAPFVLNVPLKTVGIHQLKVSAKDTSNNVQEREIEIRVNE